MIVAYARVSTDGQTLDAQQSALKAAGAERIFAEKVSGAKTDRKQLAKAIDALGAGDVLLVTRLDRLARSTRDLLNVLDAIGKAGAGFKSLGDPLIDTSSAHGKQILAILGALAEFEREVIRERTQAGLQAARARGRDPKKAALAKKLYADGAMPVQEICDTLHIGRSTLYRYAQEKRPVVASGT